MIQTAVATKTIRVCMGSGCKAWDSEKILAKLRDSLESYPDLENCRLRTMPCPRKCGGGATLGTGPRGTLLKVRNIEDAVNVLFREQPAPAIAQPRFPIGNKA
ncbi:MAG: (2Fe-2S) ferredoxin domain-containing protein [Nitrospinae bacterium]|nr:(2Fe-2S) ferredoxin domain-containing protein [Nitrospinota bacterium]